ncbi:MAG: efflux RND transporter permease subunit [Legionella sp.]|nr:efflux RND transporter permease subunit [Legionella sp.]
MKCTSYFLKHPVMAIILNCMILVLGILCFYSLPLREYPNISFPVITVHTAYPNASPELVESVVTNVMEDNLAGIEGLEFMTSASNKANSQITLHFRSGTSMEKALNATHEATRLAQAKLPFAVKTPMVVRQSSTDGLPFIGIAVESTTLNHGELTHYANLNLKNSFRGLKGVASVNTWGQPYTYAIKLDQKKLYAFGINVDEVTQALTNNRLSLPAGNYQNKIPTTLDFELKTPDDYKNLLIKTQKNHTVYLKSLASVQLTTDNTQFHVSINGHAGLVLDVGRANDANPIEVAQAVRKEVDSLQKTVPADIKIKVIIDQSKFIQASLKNIQSSILESILLVLLIVFIFLRSIRATIIPLITIPISLLGSLLFLKIAGYTINQMTLLAMVLAVGLVVDDAIIVLENIWRYIEQGLKPMDAAIKGSKQIGFAIVAMTLTLTSVYAPIALIDGLIGQLFIEFAVALAGSVFISGVVALTLSPLMCATFLHKNTNRFWPAIDDFLDQLSQHYFKLLNAVIYRKKTILLGFLFTVGLSLLLYKLLPAEIAPKEDRSLIGVYTPMLSGDNIDTIEEKGKHIAKVIGTLPEANNQLTFLGDWGANLVIPLKSHHERSRSAEQIVTSLNEKTRQLPSMDASVWNWDSGLPGMDEAGNSPGLELTISTSESFQNLFDATEQLKKALDESKQFASVNSNLRLDAEGYSVHIDKNALAKLGLNVAQVAKTIEVFFSGDKSISFQKDGVEYNLNVQGTQKPWTLDELYLTSSTGKRISLGALAQMKKNSQPTALAHVNQMRATTLSVQLAPHKTFEKGMAQLMDLAQKNIPSQYKLSWSGTAKTYTDSSHTMLLLFTLALLFIYAILAAQFENFIDPFIILFTVPLACFGALLFAYLFRQSLNIYTQIGLVTLVGLISKHGILIVEFANQLQKEGVQLIDAIKKSCALRLRPILMTTGAMIFGAIPLVLSHDAGSEARQAIGIVLIGGLCIGTLFTLFVLPAIYFMVSSVLKNTPSSS